RRRRGAVRVGALRAGDARPGRPDPDVRRAAHLELPALAERVHRAVLHRKAVAGLRPARSRGRDRGVRRPGPEVRRPVSSFLSRLAVVAVGLPVVLGLVHLGGWWLFGLAAAAVVLALDELFRLTRALQPVAIAGFVGGLLALVGAEAGGVGWMVGG